MNIDFLNMFNTKTRENTEIKWESTNFSNPNKYNRDEFIFIVTTLSMGEILSPDFVEKYIKEIPYKNKLSCSIISYSRKNKTDCLKTYEKCGFIIDIDPKSILTAQSSDVHSFGLPEELKNKLKCEPLKIPEEIVLETYPFTYNNIILESEKGVKAYVKGIFWNDITTNIPDHLLELSKRLNIPIVDISALEVLRKDTKLSFEKDISIFKIKENKIYRCKFSKYGNIYEKIDSLNLVLNMSNKEKIEFLDEVINMSETDKKHHKAMIKILESERNLIINKIK